MTRKVFVALTFTMLISNPIGAVDAYVTGNMLMKDDVCSANCGTYVQAIADVMAYRQGVAGEFACIPIGVTTSQLIAVSRNFIVGHPAIRHWAAAYLVAKAFSEAWPCRK